MSQRNSKKRQTNGAIAQPTLSLREQMSRDLKLSGKKQRTHDGYLREIRKLACFYHLPPDQLSQQQVGEYLLYLINDSQFAPGTLKVTYSALKFFYGVTCPRDWEVLTKLRVPKQKTLPDVLTRAEVQQLNSLCTLHAFHSQ